jgi:quinol monooxygenase YgiN
MNNTNLVVMTTAKSKPEKAEQVHQALIDVAEAARAQTGCVDYRIFCSTEDQNCTVNYEIWASAAERDAFNAGPDVAKFVAAVSDGFAEPPQPVEYEVIS